MGGGVVSYKKQNTLISVEITYFN
uniref:DUF4879 domain-containing protein n=1 Tax=Heterorhabditis bacteriophora TaxID=37862 RepID=A0A1I7X1Q6_HETBA